MRACGHVRTKIPQLQLYTLKMPNPKKHALKRQTHKATGNMLKTANRHKKVNVHKTLANAISVRFSDLNENCCAA